jgi:hypothetical protein
VDARGVLMLQPEREAQALTGQVVRS